MVYPWCSIFHALESMPYFVYFFFFRIHEPFITRSMKKLFLFASFLLCILDCAAVSSVRHCETELQRIQKLTSQLQATIGVAWAFNDGPVATFNNRTDFPLMSVFKYPVALAVLWQMQEEGVPLSQTVTIGEKDLHKNTYSPLRKRHGGQGKVQVSMEELLHYSVALSDNNACDVLMRYAGGAERINGFIHSLGATDCQIRYTEQEMHADIKRCYANNASPSSIIHLMRNNPLRGKYADALDRIMRATSTGTDKLKAGIPPGAVLAHKTGSSDRIDGSLKIADNDVGIVYLPDGSTCYVAVFVKDSRESDAVNASVIAEVLRIILSSRL